MPAISGRPDGRLSKYIYAEGAGGVCRDMRYSANNTTLKQYDDADFKVKNGEYRGFEKLKFTRVVDSLALSSSSNTNGVFMTDTSKFSIGDIVSLVNDSGGVILIKEATVIAIATNVSITLDAYYNRVSGTTYKVVHTALSVCSVGGKFLQTDISVNPAQVSSINALKSGWRGSWVPLLPASGGIAVPATRKILAAGALIISNDTGASWPTIATTSGYTATNNLTATYAISEIRICQYTAFSDQLQIANNEAVYGNKPVSVNVGNDHRQEYGSIFRESLGVICKNNAGVSYGENSVTFMLSDNTNKLITGCEHIPIKLGSPANSSGAVKSIDSNVSVNNQAFKQYSATELKWNGTSWGDDSKVTIVDGKTTKTDLNGSTVRVATYKTRESIGWIKNKV